MENQTHSKPEKPLKQNISLLEERIHELEEQLQKQVRERANLENALLESQERVAEAMANHKTELLEAEREARQEADILREIAANINNVNQEKLLDQIIIQLAHAIPYDSASILHYKDNQLIATAYNGPLPFEEIEYLFNPIPPNLAELIANQKPMIIPDSEKYPNWVTYPGLEKARCWLGVPLIAKASFYGILILIKHEPYFYNKQSTNLALAFANQAAIAIENARLYRETQEFGEKMQQQVALRTKVLETLYEITAVTSHFSDLQSILDKIVSKISSALDCEQVSIHLVDDSGESIRLASSVGFSPEMEQFTREIPLNNPLLAVLHKKNEPHVTYGGQSDLFRSGELIPQSVRNALGTPIRYKDKFLGVLGLVNKEQPVTREDINLLTSIADQIGIAVENDQLRKQSERAVVTQERERLARDLHDSITQSLFSLTLFAAAARELLRNGSIIDAEDFLKDIAVTSNQTHKEMRLLLYELMPSALADEGLVGALRHRLDAVESRSGIKTTMSGNFTKNLHSNMEIVLFHVANEALNNTLKHSQATSVSISIGTKDNWVQMEIKDNGIGFNSKAVDHDNSMGMSSMKQRMAAIDGHFRCYSTPEFGTTIIASAPLSK